MVVISADSRLLAVATEDPIVRIYDLTKDGPRLREMHDANVKRMRFSSTGPILAALCNDGLLRLWDISTATSSAIVVGDEPPIGVAATAGLVATTTMDHLSVHRLEDAAPTSRNLESLFATIDELVRKVQSPRRRGPDDKLLFREAAL